MKFVTLRELKINPSQVLDDLGQHDVVVIRKGKPAAAVIYLDEDMLDDYVLAHHPRLMRELKAARTEHLKSGGIDHATMKKRIARRG
jgi:antitoxin (DNA-binding transcriptional repressor) of toxin-antitoxin stability system